MGGGTDPCFFLEPTVGANGCLPPFAPVQFTGPYSAQNPMGGIPAVTLDTRGRLSGIPTLTGQYVVGVCIEEYRNGILLSRIRRDFQFNVVPCQKAIAVQLFADELAVEDGNVVSVIKSCGDSTIQFRSEGLGATAQNYEWKIFGPDGSDFYSDSGANFESLDLTLTELGNYNGYLVVNDGTVCTDTAFFQVQRTAGIDTDFISEEEDSCFLAPIEFTDISTALQSNIIGREWILNDEFNSTDSIASYEFQTRGTKEILLITTDDQGCIDTLSRMINYDPPHDKTDSQVIDTTLCFGDSIFFNNEWIRAAGTYGDILKFAATGCDSIGRELILDYWPASTSTDTVAAICIGESIDYYGATYTESGIFQHATLSLLSGCDSIRHEIDLDVQLYPDINFESASIFVPGNTPFDIPVTIDGDYSSVTWSPLDGLDCGDCPSPSVNYNSDTTYTVIATTEADCESNESIFIDFVVVPERYFFPTILSKDRTLENENNLYLQTLDAAAESVTYDLQVMDRWGSLLFDGKNLAINERSIGWSSKDVDPGVYIYRFVINEFFETKMEVGSITVIK